MFICLACFLRSYISVFTDTFIDLPKLSECQPSLSFLPRGYHWEQSGIYLFQFGVYLSQCSSMHLSFHKLIVSLSDFFFKNKQRTTTKTKNHTVIHHSTTTFPHSIFLDTYKRQTSPFTMWVQWTLSFYFLKSFLSYFISTM